MSTMMHQTERQRKPKPKAESGKPRRCSAFRLPLLALALAVAGPGAVQFCAMLAAGQSLRGAAQRGVAEAMLPGATHESVATTVRGALRDRHWVGQIDLVLVDVAGRTVLPGDAVDISPGDVVTVSVSVAAADAVPDVLRFIGLSLGHRRLRAHSMSRQR